MPAPIRQPRAPWLHGAGRVALAVVAHPDDESFGLGGVLRALHARRWETAVLCFTHGEASTLGVGAGGDLGALRARELAAAANTLGVRHVTLLDHPDGLLRAVPLDDLVGSVSRMAEAARADTLVVFDEGGITGHPDHQRATEAGCAAAAMLGLDVLAWAVPSAVAAALNAEFGTAFIGRRPHELDATITVDRARQRAAIMQHASQATDNAVLWRRLELLGDKEALRFLIGRARQPAGERTFSTGIRQGLCRR